MQNRETQELLETKINNILKFICNKVFFDNKQTWVRLVKIY